MSSSANIGPAAAAEEKKGLSKYLSRAKTLLRKGGSKRLSLSAKPTPEGVAAPGRRYVPFLFFCFLLCSPTPLFAIILTSPVPHLHPALPSQSSPLLKSTRRLSPTQALFSTDPNLPKSSGRKSKPIGRVGWENASSSRKSQHGDRPARRRN